MDSQESTSPSASARNEDDIHLSPEDGLQKEAAMLFQSRRYSECIDVLNQILQTKEDDPKVIHNIAVAEYFRDGCYDPRKLFGVFNKAKKRREERAIATGEQVDVAGNIVDGFLSGSKGSSPILRQFSVANTSASYADEFDTSVAALNTAIVWFHLHAYAIALSVLEPLYQNLELMDEITAFHTCLLLLDVALACHDALKAADVIQYLEKNFGGDYLISHGDNGSSAPNQTSNQATKVNAASTTIAAVDASNADSSTSTNASEDSLSRTLSDEALETLLLDIGGQNLPRSTLLSSQNEPTRSSPECSAPTVDLKLKLQLYKVRLLLLTRNLKATKREVKLAMNIARGRDSSTALLLKSQLEYARGNHRKAIKLLMASSNKTEAGMCSIFNNNLGCIYHQLKKHNTAAMFFSKALKSICLLRSEKPLNLATFLHDKSDVVLYNCGLEHMACGNPIISARCFQYSVRAFHKKPLLWLRLAECCLLALEKGLLKHNHSRSTNEEIKVNVVGGGKWRHLSFEKNVVSRNCLLDSVDLDESLTGDGSPRLSMLYARHCLVNALHLLNFLESEPLNESTGDSASDEGGSSSVVLPGTKILNRKIVNSKNARATSHAAVSQSSLNGDAKEAKGSLSSSNSLECSVSAFEEMRRKETQMIKQAALADLAYVEHWLNNPLKALSAAKLLLQLPDCSRLYVFFGNVYAAEALCRLNKPKEAAEHLSSYVLSDGITLDLPYRDDDWEKWRNEVGGDGEVLNGHLANKNALNDGSRGVVFFKPEESQGALYVNQASIFAMLGELEMAHHYVTLALSAIPNHPTAVLGAVYVDLLLGRTADALSKLKRFGHVNFLPRLITANRS